ncbi:hypothetical protein KVR01_000854 [Diaporthe batatas]|uniref:uncharacterized protein n=1 Tax=Diaporthe batatas TaxID=748121 RepID=UPI001D052169|nr:uncharacterized protein KVR01_000854 [Diaporthe batatas]KAG8170109.1 hypothetical protein KVR01_000854 [Diaporthe batatas]
MDSAFQEFRALAAKGEQGRRALMVALHNLAYSLETPNDTIHRYGHMNLQTAAVKIGMDLGIFKALASSTGSMTVEDVSTKAGADLVLTNRVLRYLAAIGAVTEVSKGSFVANHTTKNLTEKLTEAGISHYFGTAAPMYQALPRFLQRTGYKDPSDELDTAFQDAWKTSLPVFAWFADQPEQLACFNDYMALRREPEVSWLSVYPVMEKAKDWDPSKAVFVNVGGGVGHQCAQFKEKCPVPGRVILQDLPHSIANALPTPGVENMVYDFFEPQPIQGAKFYHMRGVLHNHPPHKVRKLLENTKLAMTIDSVLLVDEMIFPETGVNFDAASIDMTMLTAFASMERTEAQWRETFRSVGLELFRTYTYNPVSYESVMDVRLQRQL